MVINADTRKGYTQGASTVGDFGKGSLQGVRSIDLLTEGVRNKLNFFRGHDLQCILYIDEHEPISDTLLREMKSIVHACGNDSVVVIGDHNRTMHRWYDHITLSALELANGDYVVHFDQDANALRSDESTVIESYTQWLDGGYKFICQPSLPEHANMYWASTRFFICKKESLQLGELKMCLSNSYIEKHYDIKGLSPHPCCLEHTIGAISGKDSVLYPERNDEEYLIFSWSRYYSGTLAKLNAMPYKDAKDYILSCGIHGANDVLDKR